MRGIISGDHVRQNIILRNPGLPEHFAQMELPDFSRKFIGTWDSFRITTQTDIRIFQIYDPVPGRKSVPRLDDPLDHNKANHIERDHLTAP